MAKISSKAPIKLVELSLEILEVKLKSLQLVEGYQGISLLLDSDMDEYYLEINTYKDDSIDEIDNLLGNVIGYNGKKGEVSFKIEISDDLDSEVAMYLKSIFPRSSSGALSFKTENFVGGRVVAQDGFAVGTQAWGRGLKGYGTYGWLIHFDGQLCALSNWHVFCPNGNDTPIGHDIFIDGNIEATLEFYEPVMETGNIWDLAIARINNPSDAQRKYAYDCAKSWPFPRRVEFSPKPGKKYRTVGAREPHCAEGTLLGIGSVEVDFNGVTRSFIRQLVFEKITDPGDSGSVAVNIETTEVTGLLFAGDGSSRSYANPLYYYDNWDYKGTAVSKLENAYSSDVAAFDRISITGSIDKALEPNEDLLKVPRQIGGSRRHLGAMMFPFTRQSVKILDAHDDWLYVELTQGGYRGKKGWVHGAGNFVILDSD